VIDIVLERGWIEDRDLAWRAHALVPGVGRVSAADETPWRAVARVGAHVTLRQLGIDVPSLAREELTSLIARARVARALSQSAPAPKQRRRRT
jgi:hypothetical protein